MPLRKMPNIHSPRFEVRGECNRCGKCCETEDDGKPCEHLGYDDQGLATCAIYPDRWQRCRSFPAAPPLTIEECSYRFYDTWEDRELGIKEV